MKVELLAPAGNFTKLKTAINFGADAVYVGGKDFSLRSFADNFTREEMAEAVKFAHSLGKKLYVTANIFAKNADMSLLEDYFKFLEEIKADAAIISDAGVVYATKKSAPKLDIHISTQANLTLSPTVTRHAPHIPVPSTMIGFKLTIVGSPSSFVSRQTNFIIIIGPIATQTSYFFP